MIFESGNRVRDGASGLSGELSDDISRHCLTWLELVVSTETKKKLVKSKDKRTRDLSAV